MLTVPRGENCILPCSFKTGADVVIDWIQGTEGNLVHSYHHSQDQLSYQDRRFRNRTSLFKDQISRGNASLQLTGVQDQGRYRCFTSTILSKKESFIHLQVDGRKIQQMQTVQVKNNITCSSEGIYPEPELTWSTNPPSNMSFNTTTRVQQTEQQLYNISSSLILSDPGTDVVYSCTISTRRNNGTATLFESSKKGSDNVGGIIGGVVAAIVVIAAAAVTCVVLYLKKRSTTDSTPDSAAQQTVDLPMSPLETG
uniref:Ig-like domain-containing protein n=1 Tax=Anabas testudineus TaxID=64144 RepID=A0A7N6BQK5_ANATE